MKNVSYKVKSRVWNKIWIQVRDQIADDVWYTPMRLIRIEATSKIEEIRELISRSFLEKR